MDDRYKNKLEENVFASKNQKSVDEQINLFFDEITKRRRNDMAEGGLQSAAVIYPYGFAGKVCEDDGMGSHQNAFINLTKYLNGDSIYISEYGTGFFMLYKETLDELMDSIEIRIVSSMDFLSLSITSNQTNCSGFQLTTLKKILEKAKELKQNGIYPSVSVGIATSNIYFEHTEISDNMISSIGNNKGF